MNSIKIMTRKCKSLYKLPLVRVMDAPFDVKLNIPSKSYLGVPFTLTLNIKNNLYSLEKLTFSVPLATSTVSNSANNNNNNNNTNTNTTHNDINTELIGAVNTSSLLNDNFLITGPVTQSLLVMPGEYHNDNDNDNDNYLQGSTIKITLVPLIGGYISLPKIVLLWPKCGQKVFELNSTIFVQPKPEMV